MELDDLAKRTQEEAEGSKRATKLVAATFRGGPSDPLFGRMEKAASGGLDTKTRAQIESAQKTLAAAIKEILAVKPFADSSVVRGAADELETAISVVLNQTPAKTTSGGDLRKAAASTNIQADLRLADEILARVEKSLPFGRAALKALGARSWLK